MLKAAVQPKINILAWALIFNLSFLNSALAAAPILTAGDLLAINEAPSGDYEIKNDINLSELSVDTSKNMYITETFTGTLDGKNYKITGLTKPLFATINSSDPEDLASVKNLSLVTIADGLSGKGVLVGDILSNTLIENVRVEGEIKSDIYGNNNVGGIAGNMATGWASNSSISNSSASVLINGIDNLGGLVGIVGGGGTISQSYANGGVSGRDNIGGLVGENYGTISESYANGSVSGTSNVGGLIGGFINNRTISNSYSSGSVIGTDNVGGLVGLIVFGAINNSYSSGTVQGNNHIGGLVGNAQSISGINNSISIGNVAGDTNVGTVSGFNSHPASETESFGFGSRTVGDLIEPRLESAPSILSIINKIEEPFGNRFEINTCFNKGLPHLLILQNTYQSSCGGTDTGSFSNSNFFTILQTERVERINNPRGFIPVKPDFSKINLELLPDRVNTSSTEITGIKTSINQTHQVYLTVGEGLQVSLNSDSKQQLQLWVISPNGDLVLFGVITFDDNGKAVLPALEFKISGQFEFLFIESKNDLGSQPNLSNKVGGLTIMVN